MLGPICALLSSFTWAAGTTGYSRLAREHSPYAVNFTRGFVAFPLFVLLAILYPLLMEGSLAASVASFLAVTPTHVAWLTLSMFLSYAFGDVIFLLSARSLGVPLALTIASSYPLLTALWGAWMLGEKLSLAQAIGLIMTFLGVAAAILSGSGRASPAAMINSSEREKPFAGRGVLLAVLTALCWGLNSYAIAQGGKDINPIIGNVFRMGLAMALCFALGKATAPRLPILIPKSALRRWYWLFVLEGFFGSCFFLYGLSHSPLALGATLSSLAPVISIAFALLLGAEKFSLSRTLSVCSVVFGLWLLAGGLDGIK